MASYTFGNLLIVDRGSKHQQTIQLLQQSNVWFPPLSPFEYSSPNDKVILCYPISVGSKDAITAITTPFQNGNADGVFRLQLDGTNIKVVHSYFQSAEHFRKHTVELKAYITQCIKQVKGNPNITKYVLYWSHDLPSDVKTAAIQCGAVSDTTTMTYVFTSEDLKPAYNIPFKPASFSQGHLILPSFRI